MEPLCDVKHSPGLKFFQFHFTYYKDEVFHQVIGISHPQLTDRVKQWHCSIFIDATFRCLPTRFYQLVIVMMYDPISDLYLPVWYALTSGKTSQIYEHLLYYICVTSKKRLDPAHIVCDFEFAMIKAVKNQFPDARIVGCMFHFKQVLHRKMLKFKFTEDEVALAMGEGCIDRLTLIPRCDIVFRGIPDVRQMIERDCGDQGILYSRESWKKFGSISGKPGSRNLYPNGEMSMVSMRTLQPDQQPSRKIQSVEGSEQT